MKRILLPLLLCLLLPMTALASEGGALLSADELGSLRESYEAFLDDLEELIVQKGLLSEDQREQWRMYQLGDFFQNGGYGLIAAMYTPDLLEYAREEDTMLRLSCQTEAGVLSVDTMRGYTPLDSALPGLLLEPTLTGADGLPVVCRFRLTASQGSFFAWDAMNGRYSDVGVSLISDGRVCYWSDQPLTTDEYARPPVITIEALPEDDDSRIIMSAALTLRPYETGWRIDEDALQ